MIYQDKNVEEERIILNNSFNEAIKNPLNDLKDINHSKVLDNPFKEDIKETEKAKIVKEIMDRNSSKESKDTNDKYEILGKIEINKINYSGIILDEATEENLNIGISKVVGQGINKVGNLVLAGHNMKDGSLFGNLKLLDIGDTFKIFDSNGKSESYKIYRKKVIYPYDLSILTQDTKGKIKVTLFTCTNKGEDRLVLYAEKIEE